MKKMKKQNQSSFNFNEDFSFSIGHERDKSIEN